MDDMNQNQSSYSPDNGAFDDLIEKPAGSLTVDLSTIKGMENFRPGDTVNLTVKAKIPEPQPQEHDQEQPGQTELEIVSIQAQEMDRGMNLNRQREKNMAHLSS